MNTLCSCWLLPSFVFIPHQIWQYAISSVLIDLLCLSGCGHQNFGGMYMVYKCTASICLSIVNMLNRNFCYPNFLKFKLVVSYGGQTVCILLGITSWVKKGVYFHMLHCVSRMIYYYCIKLYTLVDLKYSLMMILYSIF